MPAWFVSLLKSGAVWTALLALVNVILSYALPNLPPEIVASVNVLVVVILAALGINVNKAMRARGL